MKSFDTNIINMANSQKTLETIWRVPDKLWEKLKLILVEYDPPNRIGRKRIDARAAQGCHYFPATYWLLVESINQ